MAGVMAKTKPAAKPPKKKPTPPADPPGALRLEYRSPAELAENPLNWRRHPDTQLSALSDVITEVGWAGACLFNERTGRLIDGHARRKVAIEQGCEKVPVLVCRKMQHVKRIFVSKQSCSNKKPPKGGFLLAL